MLVIARRNHRAPRVADDLNIDSNADPLNLAAIEILSLELAQSRRLWVTGARLATFQQLSAVTTGTSPDRRIRVAPLRLL